MIGLSCQGACLRATVPEIILSEAHCQANRGINAVLQSNFVSYLSFFSFGFLPAFFVYFFGEGTLVKDFPDSADSLEYQDYLAKKTIGTASEYILRTIEENSYEIAGRETYAKYIATRPRAEKFGRHGLFTNNGVPVSLTKVQSDLNKHKGNIWTAVISLRREDAERLDFNRGARWRDMLRSQTEAMASNFKIDIENLRWYAAFHNESHHPHVHLIVYSVNPKEGYLTEQGIENLRSKFAGEIFAQDLVSVYAKQTESRDTLRADSKSFVADIVSQINSGDYDNPTVEKLLRQLSDKLSRVSGKKQYGYLKADVKDIVDNIIIELSKDERIAKLYDIWYEQREEVLRTYSDTLPKRVPLVNNNTFKPIKNHVIKEALRIVSGSLNDEEFDSSADSTASVMESDQEEPMIDTDSADYDLVLKHWKAAAEKGDPHALQLLKSYSKGRGASVAMCSMSLLHHLSRIIQTRIEQNRRGRKVKTDRKTRQKTDDKKFGLGLH